MSAVIVVTPEELAAIVEAAVTRALAAHQRDAAPSQAKPPEHYTLVEAAQILRCSVPTVRRRIRLRQLEAIKPGEGGTRVLVTRRSVEALLDG